MKGVHFVYLGLRLLHLIVFGRFSSGQNTIRDAFAPEKRAQTTYSIIQTV